jgi:hypothetical protein
LTNPDGIETGEYTRKLWPRSESILTWSGDHEVFLSN